MPQAASSADPEASCYVCAEAGLWGSGASYTGALHPDRAVEAAVLERLKEVVLPYGIGFR
jgi:hypothetical protein